jgi:PAS domain S-box-containing protein
VNIKRTILGGVPRLLAIVRDITDRKWAEEALRESEERFRTVVEATKDAVIAIGREGLITVFNPAAEQMFGHKCQEILGQPPDVLMPEEYRQRHHQAREEYFAKGRPSGLIGRTIEFPALRADGQVFPIELSLSEGELGGEPFVLGVIRDITERKRAEQAILRLNQRLQIANHDLEAFTSSVCHDLRRPLHTINGFSQILAEEYAPRLDETATGYLARISTGVRHMGALIDDLMKLSRVTLAEVQRTSVDLSAMVWAVVEGLRKGQPEREVEFVVQEGITVEGDPSLLRVALENLLGNAWKFTGKHDKARIEFGVTDQDGEQIYLVRDDGAGFDMKLAQKLFGVFQRMHSAEEFEGTGVGLATVERIIRAHGGRVWAEAAVERGATFFFTVPRAISEHG